MAIARDNNATLGFHTSGTNLPFTMGSVSNGILFVYTWENRTATTITGVTYNGSAMTKVNAGVTDGASDFATLWYQLNPASGSHNVIITMTSGSCGALAVSYSGVSQVAPEANGTNSANPGSSLTDTITTIASGAWMLAGISSDAANSFTGGSGTNLVIADDAGVNSEFWDSNGGLSPGSHSLSWTCSSQKIQSVFCSIAPFVSSSPSTPRLRTLVGVGS